MRRHWYRGAEYIVAGMILLFVWNQTAIAAEKGSFELAVSLPKPTIHVGEDLVIKVITSNPTDHIVYAGIGPNGGVEVELLNGKGEDLGPHAMGKAAKKKNDEPVVTLSSNRLGLRPRGSQEVTWRYTPESGSLVPGVYKLRVHRLDATSRSPIYSNTVTLTVVP